MTRVAESVQGHILDWALVTGGVLSPWWLNFFEPGLRAFVLVCTAIIVGWRVFKMFLHFLSWLGLIKETKDFSDEED